MGRFYFSLVFVCFVTIACQALAQESVSEDKPNLNPKSLGGQAMAAAQQSGMPVLTLGLSKSCGYCKKLVQELKTDPVTSRFIVVPMTTVNNPHWTEWTQSYKPLNTSVPVMFIVRADGKLLRMVPGYAEGGAASYLRSALKHSGTVLNAAQAKKMNSTLTKAKGAYKVGNIEAAISTLVPISGTGSYAASALEADALLAEIIQKADQEIESAEAKLKESDQALQGALQMIEADQLYGRIPAKKESLEALMTKYARDEATKSVMEQAQLLASADRLAADRKQEEAAGLLQSLVQDFPGSAAAKMASARLSELKITPGTPPISAVSATRESTPKQASSARGKLRTWSDITCRFKIEATLESYTGGKVTLKKADGALAVVPLAKLSSADRAFVADQRD